MSGEVVTAIVAMLEVALVVIIQRLPPAIAARAFSMLSAINMVMIAFVGAKLTSVLGGITNVGNVLYAAVILAQCIVIERWGRRAAIENIALVFVAIATVFVVGQAIKHAPGVPGNGAAAHIDAVLAASPAMTFASFVAFAIVQYGIVVMYQVFAGRMSAPLRYLAAAIVAQVLDSVLFFSVAFYRAVDHAVVLEIMAVGFVIKVAFAMLTAPVLAVSRNDLRHPCTGYSIIH